MSYVEYLVGAYAVFVVVLAWDYFVPRLQVRKQLRDAQRRAARAQRNAPTGELSR